MRGEYSRIHETMDKTARYARGDGDIKEEPIVDDEGGEGYGLDTNLQVDFDDLLAQKKELEERKPLLAEGEAERIIAGLKESGRWKEVYKNIMTRIKDETNYMHELEELGLWKNVVEDKIGANLIEGIIVSWQNKHVKSGGDASKSGTVRMRKVPPSSEEIILALTGSEKLPRVLRTLVHEFVHEQQFLSRGGFFRQPLKSLRAEFDWLKHIMLKPIDLGRIKRKERSGGYTEFIEVHARRQGSDIALDRKHSEVVGKMQSITYRDSEDKMYPGVKQQNLIEALNIVDRLNALGFTTEQVGEIFRKLVLPDVRRGGDANSAYPSVQKLIENEADKLGLDKYDLDNLVQADRLERKIARLRAAQIAEQELIKFVPKVAE